MDVEVILDSESGATEKVRGEAEEKNDVRNFSCSCTMARGLPVGSSNRQDERLCSRQKHR